MAMTDDILSTQRITIQNNKQHFLGLIDTGCRHDFIRRHQLIPCLHENIATFRNKHDQIITVPLIYESDPLPNKCILHAIQKLVNSETNEKDVAMKNISPALPPEKSYKLKNF
ncbi:hypothetical protein PR048_018586 [Dryococelus australis]|uniref:Polyprotein n=1 Tax=Dryococelus australis TaxID=614101 RepID=A0ABQ9HDF0_9NEOP|nr:hypothetical protein PR048_018586 [Dryococelus australis]